MYGHGLLLMMSLEDYMDGWMRLSLVRIIRVRLD